MTDKSRIRRTRDIQLIPGVRQRTGGKFSYGEWAYVIGIFKTLLYQILLKKKDNFVLDIGCGTGLLGISAQSFVNGKGKYTGIDVNPKNIAFCKTHFTSENNEFIHFDIANATYSSNQSGELKPWPITSASQDAVTALSVWTHLNERDARYYMREVSRVLKQDGKALITFFYLDGLYDVSLDKRKDLSSKFYATNQKKWIFDQKAYESSNWHTTEWAKNPEDAIGIDLDGMEQLLKNTGLTIEQYYPGSWKEQPGVYFQDVLILSKESEQD